MQINRCLFQIAMPEQNLDGAQVGTGFQQVRGKAMAERVRMNMFILEAGVFGRLHAGPPQNLGVDRAVECTPKSSGKSPVGRLAVESAPVRSQRLQQRGAEHNVAIFTPLAATNVNDHAPAINIVEAQMSYLCTTPPSGV